jgi:hypothetical protein
VVKEDEVEMQKPGKMALPWEAEEVVEVLLAVVREEMAGQPKCLITDLRWEAREGKQASIIAGGEEEEVLWNCSE